VIEWFAWSQVALAGVVGVVAFAFAVFKQPPNDYTLGGTLLVGVVLLAQVVVSIVAPFVGNSPAGDSLEYWMYLITALLMVPAALIWSLIERVAISNVVLGVVGFSIAVMVVRMHHIWFVNGA
jgi:hypothetical protein